MRPQSIRNPRRNFGGTFTGAVSILRDSRRSVPFESLLEMDWLIRTDAYDHELKWIVAQPRVDETYGGLPYYFDGRFRVWIPDFMRQRRGQHGYNDPRPELIEVKPLISIYPQDPDEAKREVDERYVAAKYVAIRRSAIARGYDFSLATENEIRIQPSLDNADLIRMAGGNRVPAQWETIGRMAVMQLPRSTNIRELEQVLPRDVDAFAVALRLAWLGEVILAPSERWTRTTSFVRA